MGHLGYRDFEFDLPKALLRELIEVLDTTVESDLTSAAAAALPDSQGVYQLFSNGELVYIGKTDTEAGLRTRLARHADKIKGRPKLSGTIQFKAVRIMVFTAMDLETQLIKHYSKGKKRPAWNGSGFGSNDPGRKREKTDKKPDGFDASYPICIDQPILVKALKPNATLDAATALAELKKVLPYNLRYECLLSLRGKAVPTKPHPDLKTAKFLVPSAPHTLRVIMQKILGGLGPAWQATCFSSHVILYKESESYVFGKVI